MKFVYMTYRRTDDIGSSFAPQFACGVDHIRAPGALSDDFPLPECCLENCENEIATVDCSKPHFLLHTGAPSPLFASDGR